MNVVFKKSIFNINYYKSIFGGSIFSACDPYFPIMYYYIFKIKIESVGKKAEINYLKPAESSLRLNFKIKESQVNKIENILQEKGKIEITNEVNAINTKKYYLRKCKNHCLLKRSEL